MTTAFELYPPLAGHSPLVLDSPHSGNIYPEDFGAVVSLERLRKAEDSYVNELYAKGPELGASLVAAQFPRSYIDPNRSLLDIDASMLDAPWPGPAVPSAKTEKGIGLVWRVLDDGEPIYGRKLSVAEVKQRIVRYHQPYQRAVKDCLDAVHDHFGGVWHLNLHSMPAFSSVISQEGLGKPRPDFVLGDRDGTTCEPELTAMVASALRAMGYEVKVNDPYKGVELVRAFSDPKAQRHSLQVEVNRKLYMDEGTREKTAGFAALKANLDSLLALVAEYAVQRCAQVCGDHHDHAHGHDHDHAHSHKHDHNHRHEH